MIHTNTANKSHYIKMLRAGSEDQLWKLFFILAREAYYLLQYVWL